MARSALLFSSFLLSATSFSSAQAIKPLPTVFGYVTRIASASDFDVEGAHILIGPDTQFGTQVRNDATRETHFSHTPPPLYIGQPVDVYGKLDRHAHAVIAKSVVIHQPSPATVIGAGIIDLVPGTYAVSPSPDRIVRADGYLLRITSATELSPEPPFTSSDPLTTNLWIRYRGVQQTDGSILVEKASVRKNIVKNAEYRLRTENEYDPEAVDPDSHQNLLQEKLLGTDLRKVPPHDDAALEARVRRIGESLIPAYQKALPETDPTKIDFRFQVVEDTSHHWHNGVSLPSGIILIPFNVTQRLQSDSQLAAVLADNIAEVLEKQALRNLADSQKMLLAQTASLGVPSLGVATALANNRIGAHVLSTELEQSGRVSLFLLHDAGYDLLEAPGAWWLLASDKPKDLSAVPLPSRSANLYMNLGTTWRSQLASRAPTATVSAAAAEATSASDPPR